MPTSSQTMIVMKEQGEDPRIPRRQFSSSVSAFPPMDSNQYDIQDTSKQNRASLRTGNSSGFPSVADVNGFRAKMYFDRKMQSLRLKITNTHFNQLAENKLSSAETKQHAETNEVEKNLPHFFRQEAQTTTNKKKNDKEYRSNSTCSVRDRPKSLLDELKECVSYDSKLFPSMEMRKSLPPKSPNSVVFTLRNNDGYTDKAILDLIERETGLKAMSLQYDPVNVRTGNSKVPSRWIAEFGFQDDVQLILQNGLEVNGEKVVVKLLDNVHKMEFEAYKQKMEEERKRNERESKASVKRKPSRNKKKI
ncbi:uncharacterized protein LOC127737013 [Mytilus californianus]|uniref:uncharacterized protein LOC127737013 n=1 Tax=Mytilus californianus TaxID=6549 RepID=UPI0022483A4E|nr:uncharacterized protein LOC127737013 [Mytilus californianus]